MLSTPVPPLVAKHLQTCGYRPSAINNFTAETRLFQDIGLYGDNAVDELKLLRQEFQVDFSSFPFRKYFPSHVGKEALVLGFLWKSKWAERIRSRYPPITLEMLDTTIREKRWVFD